MNKLRADPLTTRPARLLRPILPIVCAFRLTGVYVDFGTYPSARHQNTRPYYIFTCTFSAITRREIPRGEGGYDVAESRHRNKPRCNFYTRGVESRPRQPVIRRRSRAPPAYFSGRACVRAVVLPSPPPRRPNLKTFFYRPTRFPVFRTRSSSAHLNLRSL